MKDLFGEPDEEAIYQAALAVPLDEKIRMAIAMIREYEPMALQLSDDGYYVSFSGGKDSIVMERLFKMAGVKYKSWYNNVTIDPPELVWFIKKHYPEVQWNNPEKHLLTMARTKAPGLPTRNGRWCCEVYKEQGGKGFVAVGVRAAESPRRKGLWQPLKVFKGKTVISPVLYWSEQDIWTFIKNEEMEFCELYREGFSRLGCVGCPMGGKNREAEFNRWPGYKKLWRAAGVAWWHNFKDKVKDRPLTKVRIIGYGGDGEPITEEYECYRYFAAKFKTFEDYWSWWMEEENVNNTEDADCQMWLW